MKIVRAYRWALLSTTPLFAWIAAPGCVPSSGSYCMKMCACADCSEVAEEQCVELLKFTQRTSAEKGCGSQYDAFLSCADSIVSCGNAVPPRTCEAERGALQACTGGEPVAFGSLCTNNCMRLTSKCSGGSDLSYCAQSCSSQDAQADKSGCVEAYNKYLTCQIADEDPCSGASTCTDDYVAYIQCYSDACSADPSKC